MMGPERSLSDSERVTTDSLHSAGLSTKIKAERIKRSQKTISRYLKDPEEYSKRHSDKSCKKATLQKKQTVSVNDKRRVSSSTNTQKKENLNLISIYDC